MYGGDFAYAENESSPVPKPKVCPQAEVGVSKWSVSEQRLLSQMSAVAE